jgi:hypothetical protein
LSSVKKEIFLEDSDLRTGFSRLLKWVSGHVEKYYDKRQFAVLIQEFFSAGEMKADCKNLYV